MTEQTIESKVASAILERPIATIEIEGAKYDIAPPSVATLILLSEIASGLPTVEPVSKDKIVYSVLRNAKKYRPLGDLLAVLILGAKGLTETTTRKVVKRRLFGLIKTIEEETVTIDKKAELSKILLENVRPSILFNLIVKRLNEMEIGDFFGITTSLSDFLGIMIIVCYSNSCCCAKIQMKQTRTTGQQKSLNETNPSRLLPIPQC